MNSILKRYKVVLAAMLISAIGLFSGCTKNESPKIVIKGSTTVLPITQKAAEKYQEKVKVSISIDGSGSGNGIKAIIDGNCDIANSSREIKPEEKAAAEAKGNIIKEIVAAYDMIIPVVNTANPVNNLSLSQLKGIYDGSITNWKEVGGNDETIVVVSRDSSSGTYEIWHEKVQQKTDIRKDALLQASNGAILSTISTNPKAIGYIGYGYINNTIKTVMVDNVEITLENGKSGKFPVSRKLYMYVSEAKLSAEAKAFIDYLLSEEGQLVVKDAGFIPL